jgi:hypothetical protein
MKIGVSMFCLGAVLWALVFFNNASPHYVVHIHSEEVMAATPSLPLSSMHSQLKSKAPRPQEPAVSWTKTKAQVKVVEVSRHDLQQVVQESKLASTGPGFDTRWVGTINYQVREFTTTILDLQDRLHELQRELTAQRRYRETYGGDVRTTIQAQQAVSVIQHLQYQDQTYTDWVQSQLANRIIASR